MSLKIINKEQINHTTEANKQANHSLATSVEKSASAAADSFLGSRASDNLSLKAKAPSNMSLDDLDTSVGREIGIDIQSPEVGSAIGLFVEIHVKDYLATLKEKDTQPKGADLLKKTHDWLTDKKRTKENQKPRIEYRRIVENDPNNVANIAMSFADGKKRDEAFKSFKTSCPLLSIVSAGSTTLEIGNQGVDKATANIYISEKFDEMTQQSGYTKGPLIDARVYRSFLSVDGDGTLWEKPKADISPLQFNLRTSPTHKPVLDYLRAGGILVINSGNDPQRTVDRLLLGIPMRERKTLLPRIFIAASGGHALFTLSKEGKIQVVEDYQMHGKSIQDAARRNGVYPADYIYLGDDPKSNGNDYAAFKQLGPNLICVTNEPDDKLLPKDVDKSVVNEETIVRGETSGVTGVIKQVLEKAKMHKGLPLFTDVASLRSASRSTPAADKVIAETLKAKGRDGVNALITYSDQRVNGPVVYHREQINDLTSSFAEIRQNLTHQSDPVKVGTKTSVPFNFEGLLSLSNKLEDTLQEKEKDPKNYNLTNNLVSGGASFESLMEKSLNDMHLENGSIVRILEPGNNDQSTPMYVSYQIKYILEYAKRKNINLNIQVLVMGKGGHATTALFPQFAELNSKGFSGIQEAISLGATLKDALNESGIRADFVEDFSNASDRVQIKLAKDSTNTGLNVQEAIEAYNKDKVKPLHVFVTSATASSTRQAQTFAQQYSEDRANPNAVKKYDSITAIPLSRSAKFVGTSLSDHQAVTEMYAGLAERARLYAYAFDLDMPFIPASPINRADLEDLYHQYDVLSGTNQIEASKSKSIKEVLSFFQSKFTVMETSIPWNKDKDPNMQLAATKNSMQNMGRLNKLAERYERSVEIVKALEAQPSINLSKGAKKTLRTFRELESHYQRNPNSQLGQNCYYLMGKMIDVLKLIINPNTETCDVFYV